MIQITFILRCTGCHSGLGNKIKMMLVRGLGIRDISVIEDISISKVLLILIGLNYSQKPKHCHYESLEIDEPMVA